MKPFDLINSITYKKNIVMDSNAEAAYNPFITNRALSQFINKSNIYRKYFIGLFSWYVLFFRCFKKS